jgi:hypothetical protein
MQPITLCPGAKYQFSASTRQADRLANCKISFDLVDSNGSKRTVLNVDNPQKDWVKGNAVFTAGETPEEEMWVTSRCNGYKGYAVSDDEDSMKLEVQDISLVRDV